jgi:hypothetical protein
MGKKAGTSARGPAAQDSRRAVAGISDEAVRTRTGCDWKSWFFYLDRRGAKKLDHKGIVKLVGEAPTKQRVSGWWQQMVTVAYEQARGLRKKHQKPDGYQVSASRTFAVPAGRAFAAFTNIRLRRRWLGGTLLVSRATRNKSVRGAWPREAGGGRIDVNFYPRGNGKTQVALQHSKLASAGAAARQKSYWKGQFDRLEKLLAR